MPKNGKIVDGASSVRTEQSGKSILIEQATNGCLRIFRSTSTDVTVNAADGAVGNSQYFKPKAKSLALIQTLEIDVRISGMKMSNQCGQ